MLQRLGMRLSDWAMRYVPHSFVLAILLTVVTALVCVLATPMKAGQLLDVWLGHGSYKTKGIWHFLAFSMQMCLILMTGYAMAVSGPVMRVVRRAAALPKTPGGAVALVAFVAMLAGWINWGFGLIVGAYFAREMGRQGEARGLALHYPLLGAAGYSAMLIWHGGLSGSAPLKVAQAGHLSKELGLQMAAIPLTQTIFSPMNLLVTCGLLIIIPLTCRALMPKESDAMVPISAFIPLETGEETASDGTDEGPWLDRWRGINLLLAAPMVVFLVRYVANHGVKLSINVVILLFLTMGLLLHRNIRDYLDAAADASRSCVGILVQFPLYAGIFAMMYESGLVKMLAGLVSQTGSHTLFYITNFLTAGLINIFVPSGGGQWGVQGSIALQAAGQLKAPAGLTVMTVAYGDQWTNMMQPFWALALLEITRLKARDILGYTLLLLLVSGLFFVSVLAICGLLL